MLVPRNVLSSVARIADDESTRYALGSVQLSRRSGGPMAVATDGKRLIAATWDETARLDWPIPEDSTEHVDEFSTLLSVDDVKSAVKLAKPKKAQLSLKPVVGNLLVSEASANGSVDISATNGTESAKTNVLSTAVSYPNWEKCVEKPATGTHVTVNARMLAELLLSIADATGEDEVVLGLSDHQKPVCVSSSGSDGSAYGLIMPMCNNDEDQPEAKFDLPAMLDTYWRK